jgi:hypothetical protein
MISRIARVRPGLLVAVVSAAALSAGCGSSGGGAKAHANAHEHAPSTPAPAQPQAPGGGSSLVPAPAPTGKPAAPAAVGVIRGWADALRRGHVRAAGGYFALPSEMINGPDSNGNAVVLALHTRTQADAASAGLPCGAGLLSTDQRGRYINALFRLSGRPGPGGSSCGSGAGLTARTNFVIANGRIVQWIRAPDDPGDNAPPTQSTPQGAPPRSTPQSQPPQSTPQGSVPEV